MLKRQVNSLVVRAEKKIFRLIPNCWKMQLQSIQKGIILNSPNNGVCLNLQYKKEVLCVIEKKQKKNKRNL